MRFAIVRLLIEMRSTLGCRRGQVVIIFAFAVMMLLLAIGTGIDLWQGYIVKSRLQSAVDAAALAIASTDRTQYSQGQLNTRTLNYINTNYPSSALGALCSAPGSPIACPPNPLSYGATPNIINVTYAASVPTAFMRIVGYNNMNVTATGQAQAAWPYIDFYLLLDSSPSMAIAATGAGVTTMVNHTAAQGGCGFACHEANPAGESPALGNPGGIDNYQLARNLGVLLRIDMLQQAVANLMTPAQTTENNNSIVNEYRMAIYTFDNGFHTIQTLGSDLAAAATAASNIQLQLVWDNNVKLNKVLVTTGNTTSGSKTVSSLASTTGVAVGQVAFGNGVAGNTTVTAVNSAAKTVTLNNAATATVTGTTVTFGTTTNNSDADTNYTNAMTQINAIMPNPGQGTQSPGDTPKEIVFFVTDGVDDETVASCAPSATVNCSGSRQESVMDPSYCTTIKNRGILIAVLYTEYDALPTNPWYMNHISSFNQPPPPQSPDLSTDHSTAIADALYQCASPGLYTKVATGGDISAALNQLFITAVNSVFLSQ